MTHFDLPARAPFRFESVVKSHGWYQLAPFEWNDDTKTLRTVERLASGRVVSVGFTSRRAGVSVAASARLSKRDESELRQRAAWMFNLSADFSAFYELADAEPGLQHCRPQGLGRLLRSGWLFDDIVKVMMTTNIQWSGTRRLVAALVRHFGDPLTGDSNRRAFPTARRIAVSRESTLRRLGLGYRAPYLLQLARGVVSGRYDLPSLREPARPTDEVRRDLMALPGIGPYGAATLLGLLDRYDYIGVDSEALSAVSHGFFGGRSIGAREVNAAFQRWGRFKALAYWFWDFSGQGQAPMDAWEADGE